MEEPMLTTVYIFKVSENHFKCILLYENNKIYSYFRNSMCMSKFSLLYSIAF